MDLSKLSSIAARAKNEVTPTGAYMDSIGDIHISLEHAEASSAADYCLQHLGLANSSVRAEVVRFIHEITYGDLDLGDP